MTEYENLREITTLTHSLFLLFTDFTDTSWYSSPILILTSKFMCVVFGVIFVIFPLIIGLWVIAFINQTNEITNNLLQYHELKEEQEKRKTSISI